MTKVIKVLQKMFSPFSIGCLLTLGFAGLSLFYNFKVHDPNQSHRSQWVEGLETLHNLTVDYRLKFRGPRAGSDDVVVLTVDERAIQQHGRWPWPRRKIAKVIETAMTNKAKTISFDIIFSEKQDALLKSLDQFQKTLSQKIPGQKKQIRNFFETHQKQYDDDLLLTTTMDKYSEHMILGAVYEAVSYTHLTLPTTPYV